MNEGGNMKVKANIRKVLRHYAQKVCQVACPL